MTASVTARPMRSGLTVAVVAEAVRRCWSDATSIAPQWRPEVPAVGQCAVTALIVQDFFGGDLLRAVICGESHYWNRLPNGEDLDLTAEQFTQRRVDSDVEIRDRSYVLGFAETEIRYRELRTSVLAALGLDEAALSSTPA